MKPNPPFWTVELVREFAKTFIALKNNPKQTRKKPRNLLTLKKRN